MKEIKCIMLIDDNKIDNFFHERVIRKYDSAIPVIAAASGQQALDYLTATDTVLPEIIFLDINMPGMSGWEFIGHYKVLPEKLHSALIVPLISDFENPEDIALEATKGIFVDFRQKPLTKEIIGEVIEKLQRNPELRAL